jgi:hypothetical protein
MDLKLSTACTIDIGPMVDSTDGNTEETGLTIAQANVLLAKNGGLNAQKNDATSAVYDANGVYKCALNTTDTNTLGRLKVFCHPSGAAPWWDNFKIITANEWERKYNSGTMTVDAIGATALTSVFDKVFTTAATEAYPTKNTTFTLAKFMYGIWQFLNDFVFTGTTRSTKKIDGTTEAMTHTIDSTTTSTELRRTT